MPASSCAAKPVHGHQAARRNRPAAAAGCMTLYPMHVLQAAGSRARRSWSTCLQRRWACAVQTFRRGGRILQSKDGRSAAAW